MIENQYLSQARQGNNRWWRYILTLFIVISFTIIAQVIIIIPISILGGTLNLAQMSPVTLLIVAMVPFGFLTLGLWFGMRYLHQRSFMSIINPTGQIDWVRLFASGGLWLILLALGDIISALIMPGNYAWNFQPRQFLPFLIVAVLLVPIQTSAEEFIFRGYLPQGLGLLSKGILLPWVVPAVLFGLLHGLNPEVSAYGFWIMMVYYIGFGLLLGWITLRSRSLEMSIGLHLANNLYGAMAVTYPSAALQTPAFFTMKDFNPQSSLVVFVITGAIYLLVFSPKFRRWNLISTALILTVLLGACAPLAGSQRSQSNPGQNNNLLLTDCELSEATLSQTFKARCGTLEVFENQESLAGRKIGLKIVVIPAKSTNPAPDPVFLLAGGPGQAASEAFLTMLPSLDKVNFKHDLVMVDQRGTGGSNALTCPENEQMKQYIPGEVVPLDVQQQMLKDCLKTLDADPRYYTTTNTIKDLEAVRQALGYGPIDLLGVSYGTRVAWMYMTDYPQNVRSALVNGVVPPDWAIGASIDSDAQRAINLILTRCTTQPACSRAFLNLKADFTTLMARLDKHPEKVSLQHPLSGKMVEVIVTKSLVAATIRLMTYSEDYAVLIPFLIESALQKNEYQPLAAQYLTGVVGSSESINNGLYLSVTCAEDVPLLPEQPPADGSFFQYDVNAVRKLCEIWPHGALAEHYRQPLKSNVPVLILTGEADPVTPPRNGDLLAAGLPNSRHVIVPGMGHALLFQGCLPKLVADFINQKDSSQLDLTCVKHIQPMPFFISPLGPQP